MADKKTDSSSTPLSDDQVIPSKGGLSAKSKTTSHPAGAEPTLDTLFHRTDLRFCCASKMPTEGEVREVEGYRDSKQSLVKRRTVAFPDHTVLLSYYLLDGVSPFRI